MAVLKQKVLLDDVNRAIEKAGTEQDRKIQIDEITKERSGYAEKVRSLSDQNRRTLRELNEEILPRLNLITSKIRQMENSKNVKLEVRISIQFFSTIIFYVKCIHAGYSYFVQNLTTYIKV